MRRVIAIFLSLLAAPLAAQENIPIGTWRSHFSYYNTIHVAASEGEIFAATENSLYIYNKGDNSIRKLSTLDGLQGADISFLCYDPARGQLFVGYHSGNLDVIRDNQIYNLSLADNAQILGPKDLNHLLIHEASGFLSTAYGLLKLNLKTLEVRDTYRGLGEDGQTLPVYQAAVLRDTLFLATESGVIAGSLSGGQNLLDYQNWKRYTLDEGIPREPISVLAVMDSHLLAGIDNDGLYLYDGNWKSFGKIGGEVYHSITPAGKDLLLVHNSQLSRITSEQNVIPVRDVLLSRPNQAIEDNEGLLWIADGKSGLIHQKSGQFYSYTPSGPYTNMVARLSEFESTLYAVPRVHGYNEGSIGADAGFYAFGNGIWTNYNSSFNTLTEFTDIVDAEYNAVHQSLFLASTTDGLLKISDTEDETILNEKNSPLELSTSGASLIVPALASAGNGLWVLNYDTPYPLHFYSENETWSSYDLNLMAAHYPVDLLTVGAHVWMIIDPERSGGLFVFDPETGDYRYLSDMADNGGLSDSNVNTIAMDRDGMVWIGTDQGISVIANPAGVLSGPVDAIEPVYEDQYLLRDEKITALKIDGGNRKWIGTTHGVWLFNDAADQELLNFTTDNSPLPDNHILDIEIVQSTGEVFFATPKGLISYRGTSTEPSDEHENVKIFPNPVTADFEGTVGISGLVNDANVKITDISGKLIWQTQANGGTATWNVADYNGRRAATGVYLVFSAAEDGEETFVGKIAVIN